MLKLEITNEQARALRAVLNITGKHCEHIEAPSIEKQAAEECGMDAQSMEQAMIDIWNMTVRFEEDGHAGE